MPHFNFLHLGLQISPVKSVIDLIKIFMVFTFIPKKCFYHQSGQFKSKSYFSRIVRNQQKQYWVKDISIVEIFYRIKQEFKRKAGGGDKRWPSKRGLSG
jgi:hypothetical protein